MSYVPPAGKWESRPPSELGLRADGLAAAVAYHRAHESQWARDFMTRSGRFIGVADEPADSEVLGPVKPREDPNGLVIRHGFIAAEWGDTARSDMSFSIAKSYLSIVAGLAVARGLIRDLDDPVSEYKLDDAFDSPQNRTITWRHLLQQTSEWQGTLWGKPDTIDHNRDLGQSDLGHTDKGRARPLKTPGTLLGVQRRPRQPPEPVPAAALPPLAGRRPARRRDGPDRRQCRLVLAALSQRVDRVRRPATAVGAGRLALGRRDSGCRASITRGSGCWCSGRVCGASVGCWTRRGWRSPGSRARSTRSTGCCGG